MIVMQIGKRTRNCVEYVIRFEREEEEEDAPSSYNTMPHYFPTEQVEIVGKLRFKKYKKSR
jgi:hypothetical protein